MSAVEKSVIETWVDQTVEIRWSSSATRPTVWLSIKGGQSLDPRDPSRLARLPLSNCTYLDASTARELRAALDAWIERMDRAEEEHPDAYLLNDLIEE